MPRRAATKPPSTPVDFGVCMLALEYLQQLGLPCASAAEVLRCQGAVDTTDPEAVEDERLHLMFETQKYLVTGMMVFHHLRAQGRV